MEDKQPKYKVEETVKIVRGGMFGYEGHLGIVREIEIIKKTKINEKDSKETIEIIYTVQPTRQSIFHYDEDCLSRSIKQLHSEAFQPSEGYIIQMDNKEHVIEKRRDDGSSFLVRELSPGRKYNPNGKLKELNDSSLPLDIVGKLEKQLAFK